MYYGNIKKNAIKTQKFFSKNEQNNEHYKQLNPKMKIGS